MEAYIRRYLEVEDGDLADKEVAAGLSLELKVILGDRYNEEKVGALENFDLNTFLQDFGYKPGQTEQELVQGMLTCC